MDFVIGLFIGLFIGGWIGLSVAALMMISREKDIQAELSDGCDEAIKSAIETLKRQKHNSRLDDETWQADMERDAQLYEAGE